MFLLRSWITGARVASVEVSNLLAFNRLASFLFSLNIENDIVDDKKLEVRTNKS